jgi:hypothetical protein
LPARSGADREKDRAVVAVAKAKLVRGANAAATLRDATSKIMATVFM